MWSFKHLAFAAFMKYTVMKTRVISQEGSNSRDRKRGNSYRAWDGARQWGLTLVGEREGGNSM